MKSFITTLAIAFSIAALGEAQAQSARQQSGSSQQHTYQRKTTKHRTASADSSDLGAILKDSANAETGPILNDNGNVNSTGAIDGSRSSTGRPDADTSAYVTRKKKTVIRTGSASSANETRKEKKP